MQPVHMEENSEPASGETSTASAQPAGNGAAQRRSATLPETEPRRQASHAGKQDTQPFTRSARWKLSLLSTLPATG